MHPAYADPAERAALLALLGSAWPRLPARIARAAAWGWPWDEVTTPFLSHEAGRPVAHAGVIELPIRLAGRELRVAGIHAVCTAPAFRRRGHSRAVMEAALAWADARWPAAKLHTDQPWLYERYGFRGVPQHRLRVARRGPAGPGRAVGEGDLPAVHALLAARAPISDRFAPRDPGWLFGIDQVLATGGLEGLVLVEDRVLVACEVVEGVLRIHDVVAAEVPPLEVVLAAAPAPFAAVELWTAAERIAPEGTPVPGLPGDVLMVRGSWPDLPPFAVGRQASH